MSAAARNQQPHIFQFITRSHAPNAGLQHPRTDRVTRANRQQNQQRRQAITPSSPPQQNEPNDEQWRHPIFLRRDRHPKTVPNWMRDEMIEKLKQEDVLLLQKSNEIQDASQLDFSRCSQRLEARCGSQSSNNSSEAVLTGNLISSKTPSISATVACRFCAIQPRLISPAA